MLILRWIRLLSRRDRRVMRAIPRIKIICGLGLTCLVEVD